MERHSAESEKLDWRLRGESFCIKFGESKCAPLPFSFLGSASEVINACEGNVTEKNMKTKMKSRAPWRIEKLISDLVARLFRIVSARALGVIECPRARTWSSSILYCTRLLLTINKDISQKDTFISANELSAHFPAPFLFKLRIKHPGSRL